MTENRSSVRSGPVPNERPRSARSAGSRFEQRDEGALGTFALAVAVAAILRFYGLGSAGISHWDAGTYTAGPLGVGPYGERELVLFQAPPLVPALFRALFAYWAPLDTIAMGAVACFGVATVVAVYLIGRAWVGDRAAAVGAAALAGMEMHVIFSRQALTDVPFTFFLLLALGSLSAAVRRKSRARAVWAGLAAGAAILTKYDGFMALLVPALWLVGLGLSQGVVRMRGSPLAGARPPRRDGSASQRIAESPQRAVSASRLAESIHRSHAPGADLDAGAAGASARSASDAERLSDGADKGANNGSKTERSHAEFARAGWRAWVLACAIAALPAAWLVREIERTIGFWNLVDSHREWFAPPGLYLLPRTAKLVGRSLFEWASPIALASAALGFVVMARRRFVGDLLLLTWIASFLCALALYRFYPRLVVPLLPPIALAAGVGLETFSGKLIPGWRRARTAVLALVVLLSGAWSSRAALTLEDRGYAIAARYLEQGAPDPRPDLLVTQHAILFYLRGVAQPYVCYDEPGAVERLERGEFRTLVGDLRLLHAPRFRAYIEQHEKELRLAAAIGNPLPPTTIVNCAGFEGLNALRSDATSKENRATLETIRVWKHRGPDGR